MPQWPSSWRESTLREADIPVTPFALTVLNAWRKSTPIEPWTNNPLGMPARGYSAPRALNSPYAAFPSMQAFRAAFTKAAHSGRGKPLHTMLGTADSHAEAWRVINSLKWPAHGTETDYPSALLDLLESDYREKLQTAKPKQRRTAGTSPTSHAAHQDMRRQLAVLHQAAHEFNDVNKAIAHIVRKLG